MSATSQLIEYSATKTCSKCGLDKNRSQFSKRAGYGDGFNAWCKSCHAGYMAEYSKEHPHAKQTPEQVRKANYRKIHGISVERYDEMLVAQGGKCAICQSTIPGNNVRNFAIDHCHTTGNKRGLLCRPCNTALGLFRDSPDTMERAAEYVRRHREYH